jgi:hypothetical protein
MRKGQIENYENGLDFKKETSARMGTQVLNFLPRFKVALLENHYFEIFSCWRNSLANLITL